MMSSSFEEGGKKVDPGGRRYAILPSAFGYISTNSARDGLTVASVSESICALNFTNCSTHTLFVQVASHH